MTITFPPPVHPGDRVGVAALSGPILPGRVERGAAELSRLGFEPVLASNLHSRHGLFAGSDDERLGAFHELAADPSLSAIVFARGGSGLLRVLPRIDWDLLARHPRAYVGYSDLTPFLLAVVGRLGLVAFHGPMAAADLARSHPGGEGLAPEEERSFLDALAGRLDGASYPVSGWLREGVAEGPLLGGCLSLLTSVLGTEWAPRLDGSILFWEDVGEPLYRLDRMLTHLDLSGNLSAIRGMVIGHCRPSDGPSEGGSDDGRLGQLSEVLERYPWPVAHGLPAGHEAPNLTLPLGLRAILDPKCGTLTVRTR
jgi:muramoyltetrapeptide carboxypeptidase